VSERLLPACRHEPFIEKWFGKDGGKKLHLQDFMQFIVQLHGIFDELEFALLDADGSGHITGLDLARSLVAPASVLMIDKLLDRVRFNHCWTMPVAQQHGESAPFCSYKLSFKFANRSVHMVASSTSSSSP
jgi:hypothetical protein